MLSSLVVGCDTGSVERACEPTTGEGCSDGLRCTINANASPVCVARAEEPSPEGALCTSSEACDEGLACLVSFGVARCQRFCPLDLSPEERDAPCLAHDPLSACLLSLPERTDIGFCVSPCLPDHLRSEMSLPDGARCPEGPLSCQLDVDLPLSVCAPTGAQALWDPCDAAARCERGLMCAQEGEQRRCVSAHELNTPCPAHQLPLAVSTHLNMRLMEPYVACWPSVSLSQAIHPREYRLTLEPLSSEAERADRCALWGGRLASGEPHELGDERLIESLERSLRAHLEVARDAEGDVSLAERPERLALASSSTLLGERECVSLVVGGEEALTIERRVVGVDNSGCEEPLRSLCVGLN